MAERAFISRFSPNRTDPKMLEDIFVQRHKLAEVWLEKLRDSVLTGTKHHLLAVGPRGCGKSHLVNLLINRLKKDPTILDRVRIAWLPEDETTTSFWKFLLRILRALNSGYDGEFPPPPRDQLDHAEDDQRTTVLIDYLVQKLAGRTLLVVVENLDDVMRSLKEEGQKRWRGFLQEHPIATTLATAQQLSEDLSDRERPFFNFFEIEHLKPLTANEALELLQKIAEHTGNTELADFLKTPTGRARVRALRHITGGGHRVFIILSEFATRENLDNLVGAFEELLDELTPYYQERLRWLADQQREIVEFICKQVQTVKVKDIASELYISEQTVAAQLKSLRGKGYVTAEAVGRESRYQLAEPLMRLCVEVKDTRREPIRLIVEFLRVWYDQEVVESRLQCLPTDANRERRYLSAALKAHLEASNPLDAALTHDLETARASGDADEVARVLIDTANTEICAEKCADIALQLLQIHRTFDAINVSQRALSIKPNCLNAHRIMGLSLQRLNRSSEATKVFEKLLQHEPSNAYDWYTRGSALRFLGRLEEALSAAEKMISLNSEDTWGWSLKSDILEELERYSEALNAIESAIAIDPKNMHILCEKAYLLNHLHRNNEALELIESVLANEPNHGTAWLNKSYILKTMGQRMRALAAAKKAVQINPGNEYFWQNAGSILLDIGKTAEALSMLERATKLDPTSFTWCEKADALVQLYRNKEAVACSEQAILADPMDIYAHSKHAYILDSLGRTKEAIRQCEIAIEIDVDSVQAWRTKMVLLSKNGYRAEAMVAANRVLELDPNNNSAKLTLDFLIKYPNEVLYFEPGPSDIISVFTNPIETWDEEINKISNTKNLEQLTYLGRALIQSLAHPSYSDASNEKMDAWLNFWKKLANKISRLTVAVRIFTVGLHYLKERDERIIFDLVQEERAILSEVFKLNDNTSPEDRAD